MTSYERTTDLRSSAHLERTLATKEYFTLAFGSMVGVGWVLVIDDWLTRGGPLGAMLGFLLGGLMLLPIGYVYSELVLRIPDAGSEVAYTSLVFRPWVSFAAGWFMTLAYLIVCPWEAVAIGKLLAYIFPSLNVLELYRIGGKPVYLTHVLAGVALTAFITGINYRGVKLSATFQNATTFGLLVLFVIFSTFGVARGSLRNAQPAFSSEGWSGTLLSILLVLQIVPYFMTGFESVPKCCEEARPGFKSGGFRRAIFLAILVGAFFYIVVIGVVALVYNWRQLVSERFATAVAFERTFHSRLLVNLILFGAMLSLLKVFNGNFLTATRLLFALGRTRFLHPGLGTVHNRYQTPAHAVLSAGFFTVIASLLGEAILIPITEVGSLASAVGWLATCSAYLKGAGRSEPVKGWKRLIGFLGALVSVALIMMKILAFVPGHFGFYEYTALGLWFALGFLLYGSRKT